MNSVVPPRSPPCLTPSSGESKAPGSLPPASCLGSAFLRMMLVCQQAERQKNLPMTLEKAPSGQREDSSVTPYSFTAWQRRVQQ